MEEPPVAQPALCLSKGAGAQPSAENDVVYHRDATYRLRYTFAHDSDLLHVVFTGENVVDSGARVLTDDENWGIGSLTVKTD